MIKDITVRFIKNLKDKDGSVLQADYKFFLNEILDFFTEFNKNFIRFYKEGISIKFESTKFLSDDDDKSHCISYKIDNREFNLLHTLFHEKLFTKDDLCYLLYYF